MMMLSLTGTAAIISTASPDATLKTLLERLNVRVSRAFEYQPQSGLVEVLNDHNLFLW